jgi:hypothetical protein
VETLLTMNCWKKVASFVEAAREHFYN